MIRNSGDAINALGGTFKVASWLNEQPSTVSMWRRRGLPGRVHYRIARELEARSVPFDEDALFGCGVAVNDMEREGP
jgi:hypothetical protein